MKSKTKKTKESKRDNIDLLISSYFFHNKEGFKYNPYNNKEVKEPPVGAMGH